MVTINSKGPIIIQAASAGSPVHSQEQLQAKQADGPRGPIAGDKKEQGEYVGRGALKAGEGYEFTRQEQQEILELKRRDAEVHAHEQAHIAAGGRYVRSGASYHYETGPDGKRYAVGGEVSIDTSEEKDPKATIRKMETVRRAALAPAHPSSKDRAVAAEARIKAAEAASKLARTQRERAKENSGAGHGKPADRRTSSQGTAPPAYGPSATGSAVTSGSMLNVYT